MTALECLTLLSLSLSPSLSMGLFSVYIVNRAGSLIYQKDLAPEAMPRLDGNDYIRCGSTFHTLSSIAEQIAPTAVSSGIAAIQTDTFALRCLHSLTGLKFFVLAERDARDADLAEVLSAIYKHYSDYVMKNPFYTEGMLIKVALFEEKIDSLAKAYRAHYNTHYRG